MKTLLQIKSSIFSDRGQSSRLANDFVARWLQAHPGANVVVRDFSQSPVPHLTAERFQGFALDPHERTPEQVQAVTYSDMLIDEIRHADVVVFGMPMYNFGIPSNLKAYFDHIARAGVTFRYTESGPVGLLDGKKAYVFASSGGLVAGTPMDTLATYMRIFLGFVGITDVEVVYADGMAVSAELKDAALANAKTAIARLIDADLAAL